MSEETIRILEPGDEAAMESFLRSRMESSMFLLSNMRRAGLVDRGQRLHGTYAASFTSDQITGIVAHFWNRMLVFQSTTLLAPLIRAAVAASGRMIGGLVGPGDQVRAALEYLGPDRLQIQLNEIEGLYALNLDQLIVPPTLSQGWRARRMQASDIQLMTDWRLAYNLEALGAEDSPEFRLQTQRQVEESLQFSPIWILDVDGESVASTAFNATLSEAVQVGGVWTPPELRRRGYARSVVAASLLDARAEGVQKAILFTSDENIPAIKAYQALGFRRIGEYRLILLKKPVTIAS